MNRKNLPLLLMLTAGAVTCVITCVKRFEMSDMLIALFTVLLIFYVLGSVLKWTLDFFEKQNEEKLKEEGEVIEKESEESEDSGNGGKEEKKDQD